MNFVKPVNLSNVSFGLNEKCSKNLFPVKYPKTYSKNYYGKVIYDIIMCVCKWHGCVLCAEHREMHLLAGRAGGGRGPGEAVPAQW